MKTIMIGTFPPPVHGMATINQAIFERLLSAGWDVQKLDTAPTQSKNPFLARLSRLTAFFPVWRYLLRNRVQGQRVYMALSGGWGQLYDIVTALLCRIKGMQCVLHHHSVAYLVKKRMVTSILFHVAGMDTIHVALGENMKKELQKKYGCERVIVLSNSALLCLDVPQSSRRKLKTVGYLSNITKEKGGWNILKLAEKSREAGLPIRFRVAGPCQDADLRSALQKSHEAGNLEWIGSVYDADKLAFLNSIDVFLFPSHYQNEAEPLVVWEALLSGIPVIAYERGCISSQVGQAGELLPQDADFVASALTLLDAWFSKPEMYRQYAEAAQNKRGDVARSAADQWKEFLLALEGEE